MTTKLSAISRIVAFGFLFTALPTAWAQQPGGDGTAAQPTTEPGRTPSADKPDAPDRTVSGSSGASADEGMPQPHEGESAAGASTAPSDTTTDAAAAVTAQQISARKGARPIDPRLLAPAEEEAVGTCATPRQAWLQLLYWLQKDKRWRPEEAVKCFNGVDIPDPMTLQRRAEMFKETLDSRGVWIKVDYIPIDPEYRDEHGFLEYREPGVAGEFGANFYLERIGDKWLFSAETVARIPDVYPFTGTIERYIPEWLKLRVAGVEAWKYLLLLLVYLLARIISFAVVHILDRYVSRIIARTKAKYLDRVVDRAEDPVGLLVIAMVFYISVPMLLLPIRFTELMLMAIKGLTAYAGVWLGYRLIDVLTDFMMSKAEKTESKLDDQLVPLVSKTLKVFVSVVGGIFIMQNLGINVSSLLAGVGLGGLAFALAAKDTVANFFGSVMIFIDKPFQIGDWVVIGNTEGVIEEVGFRTSRVRTFYNSLVTVPNALVTNAVVDNYGAREYRRYVANVGLTYDTPPDKVEAFCEGARAIIAGMPEMRKDYYLVEFKEFGDSGLIIMIYCFMTSKTWNDELRTRTVLNLELMRMADEIGVSFAFPTQTLHINSLPELGEDKPNHYGPTKHEDLAQIIDGFGPGGQLARPKGLRLTQGYECNADAPRENKPD